MTTKKYDPLLLQNQLCFPLYASARKIVAAYHPMLKKLGITYPQYITMMVLWEEKEISMHDLGQRLGWFEHEGMRRSSKPKALSAATASRRMNGCSWLHLRKKAWPCATRLQTFPTKWAVC